LICPRAEKSFYSLEYTGHNFSDDEEDEEACLDSLGFDDYSKIIQELQSHRKEIEKLQTDISQAGSLGAPENLPELPEREHQEDEEGDSTAEQTEDNQGSELIPMVVVVRLTKLPRPRYNQSSVACVLCVF
jgi:hypothetical protein